MERVAKEWDGQISIHAPVKGATRPILYNANETAFISIHAPVKGATGNVPLLPYLVYFISIHAPVKGATSDFIKQRSALEISIHAPVKGATLPAGNDPARGKFQSTPP